MADRHGGVDGHGQPLGEILSAVMVGALPAATFVKWLAVATSGNILGGVIIVSLLNWGQLKVGAAR